MKLREAARGLFNERMAVISARQEELRKTIADYEEFKREFKKTNNPEIALVEFILEMARRDLGNLETEREQIQDKAAAFYQEIRMDNIADIEVDYERA